MMEFGDEYDQFLQREKRKIKHPNKLINRFLTDKLFRYIVIGVASFILLLTVFIIIKVVTSESLIFDNRFIYIYQDPTEIDEKYYNDNYIPIYKEASKERNAITQLIVDYYDLAVIDTDLKSGSNQTVKEYKGYYSPQFKTLLDPIFVNSLGRRIISVSTAPSLCINDPSTGKCYTDLNKYIFDKFLLLDTPERIFNDIVTYQSTIYENYYMANNKTATNNYRNPLRSTRKFDSLNFLTYYLDYKKIPANDETLINNEMKFYEEMIRYFFDNYEKISNTLLKKVTVKQNTDDMKKYLNTVYVKYVNLRPKIKNGILADIEIEIDFVPKGIDSKYRDLVRYSENWINSGIATAKITSTKVWTSLFNGTDYGFAPFQVDIINNEFRDYTSILRNQETFYNPILDLNEVENNPPTYLFKNPVIIYNNIIRYNNKDNPVEISKMAKNIFKAYEIRGKDLYAAELLAGGYLDYTWDYVYNDAPSKLNISENLDIKGFAVGIQVTLLAKNSSGNILESNIIPIDELIISGESVRLK